MRLVAVILVVAAAAAAGTTGPHEDPPVAVYAALDGTWRGEFVGYDATGVELFRLTATHTYRTVSETEQAVEIRDVMDDGTVITGRGVNSARRLADGSLAMKCIVDKSDGQRVDHDGRLVRGPDGDEQIVWYSAEPGRTETFRELVHREGDASWYEINGMGRYGESLILMTGRYKKIEDP